MFRQIDDRFFVAAQIGLGDVAQAGRDGFTLIINNRPDGEDPGAAQGDAIAMAARQAGLDYAAIPVGSAGFTPDAIAALETALATATGPVLAYCRSGTRSTFLWALARAHAGETPDVLFAKAAGGGYDLNAIGPMISAIAAAVAPAAAAGSPTDAAGTVAS